MNGGTIDFIADTSAIIGLLRRDPQVEQKVSGKTFAITFVTLAELSLGVLKSANPMRPGHVFRMFCTIIGCSTYRP